MEKKSQAHVSSDLNMDPICNNVVIALFVVIVRLVIGGSSYFGILLSEIFEKH